MPRKSKKAAAQPPAPKPESSFDDLDEDEDGDDGESPALDVPPPPLNKQRDWRDVEKLKEERRLRRLIDDDLDF